MKVVQIIDKNSNLNNEVNQLRMKVQFSEDQSEKTAIIYK